MILNDDTYKIILNTACSPEKIPDHLKSFYSYINAPDTAHRSALVDKIDQQVKKYNTSEWRRRQMTLSELMEREREIGHEEGFAEGIEQGLEQGIEQGIEQGLGIGAMKGKRKMALAMLGEKIPANLIAKCTGMTQAEIEEMMM